MFRYRVDTGVNPSEDVYKTHLHNYNFDILLNLLLRRRGGPADAHATRPSAKIARVGCAKLYRNTPNRPLWSITKLPLLRPQKLPRTT